MNADLRSKLEILHVELGKTARIDPDARALLITLLGDITRLLEQSSPSAPHASSEDSIAQRLDHLAVRFEAEHPALGTAIRQVVDTLGKAGI